MHNTKKWIICFHYIEICLKWCLFSIATGLTCGVVGTALYHLIVSANSIRIQHSKIIWLLPIAGLIIIRFYHMLHIPEDTGADLIFDSVREQKEIPSGGIHSFPVTSRHFCYCLCYVEYSFLLNYKGTECFFEKNNW